MKILQINSVCGIGSTGRIAVDLHDNLIKHGHQCHIAYGRGTAKHIIPEDAHKIGSNMDVTFHAFMTRITDRIGFFSKKATIKFIKKIKEYNPDVIHLHNLHGYYINIKQLFNYLKDCGKPIVWTLHDCWAFTGHCTNFEIAACSDWKYNKCQSFHKCPSKREYPSSYIFDHHTENYRIKKELFTSISNMTIVTPSKWLAELVKESFLSKYPIRVVPNGIDLHVFKPTTSNFRGKYGLQNKRIILGVANVWKKNKGFDDFMQIAALLVNKAVIVLVGLDKKQIKSLPKNIIGIGRTHDIEELAAIYTAADVFVNPTYEDNFPTVNLEAMACGIPVITYKTGGSPEAIDDRCGIVVEKGDYLNLIHKIQFIQKDTAAGACVKRAEKYYDNSKKCLEYITLYDWMSERN